MFVPPMTKWDRAVQIRIWHFDTKEVDMFQESIWNCQMQLDGYYTFQNKRNYTYHMYHLKNGATVSLKCTYHSV